MKNIRNFKKGDCIVRVEPSLPYHSGARDRSYLGEKMIFVGVANGRIYLTDIHLKERYGVPLDIPFDVFQDSWERWVEPSEIYNGSAPHVPEELREHMDELNDDFIHKDIKRAVAKEDYEEAERLRKTLKNK